jgi:DMSO reductase anchor subunit
VPARPVWNSWRTPVAFFATAAATGPLLAYFAVDRSQVGNGWLVALVVAAALGSLSQVAVALHLAATVRRRSDRQHQGTAHLLLDRFGGCFQGRLALAGVALLLLAGALLEPLAGPAAAGRLTVAVVVVGVGELLGRWLFYVTIVPFRVAGSFFRTRR